MTLHTNPGCTLDTSRANADITLPVSANTFVGTARTTDCNALVNFNSGCSIQDTDGRSFGIGLNGQQGGVYATLWDDAGIKICMSIPMSFWGRVGAQALTYLPLRCEKGFSLVVSSPRISPTRPLIRRAGQHQKPSSRQLPAQLTSSSRITYLSSTLLSVVTLVTRHTALRDAPAPALNKLQTRPILMVVFDLD